MQDFSDAGGRRDRHCEWFGLNAVFHDHGSITFAKGRGAFPRTQRVRFLANDDDLGVAISLGAKGMTELSG